MSEYGINNRILRRNPYRFAAVNGVACPTIMPSSPTKTGEINRVSGIYSSACHAEERTILAGQAFPRCGHYNSDTVWTYVRSVTPALSKYAAPSA
jgi:hypothetical protein